MDEAASNLTRVSLRIVLLERVDEFDGREEANPFEVMFDRLNAECRGDVDLAGAVAAEQHDVVGIFDELALMKLAHERLIDLAAGKIKDDQVEMGQEASDLDLISP